jgi:hypothetical protein
MLQYVGCDKFALANAGTPFTDFIPNQFLSGQHGFHRQVEVNQKIAAEN